MALGYIVGALLAYFLPCLVTLRGKGICFIALSASLIMFLPISPAAFAPVFFVSALCCTAAIGIFTTLAIYYKLDVHNRFELATKANRFKK